MTEPPLPREAWGKPSWLPDDYDASLNVTGLENSAGLAVIGRRLIPMSLICFGSELQATLEGLQVGNESASRLVTSTS